VSLEGCGYYSRNQILQRTRLTDCQPVKLLVPPVEPLAPALESELPLVLGRSLTAIPIAIR
jgi:hypothetical protein